MLTDANIKETIEIPYAGTGTFPIQEFELPPNQFFNVSHIVATLTAGGSILIANFTIRDETGATVIFIGINPWQFAGTTVLRTIMQTPRPQAPAIFAARAISGAIAADLHVLGGWTIQFVPLFADPAIVIDAVITLNR
jgi:hypothetical protein